MTNEKAIAPESRPLGKSYEPQTFESSVYEFWEKAGCFAAADRNEPGQESYCIVIPPPNVTGVLHMGHALTNTIQDTLIRWRRMMGDNTLWMPGTDHAGIATQAVVEKAIAKEGKSSAGRPMSRHDMGRPSFVDRVWKWKEEHGSQITRQLKRLGSSLDWSRERFTMDPGLSKAVREVFVRLYEEDLIYRGERIINWCPRCQTALSDLEVVPTERKGFFFHLVYPIVEEDRTPVKNPDGTDAQLIVATTRPETLLGDTAVAVHPEDERYRHLFAQDKAHDKKRMAVLPLLGRLIPLIADEYVDREFGSGALKVTPAHDFNDYELGRKHNLPIVSVMGKDGRITPAGGPYSGLKFAAAREQLLQDLKEQRLLVRTEDHVHKVGLCQRCETVAEPIISKQWFVKIEPLAKPAIEAVQSGKIQFTPKSWEKTYFEWMFNIRDWCISRQLWWGHQIPAWYCGRCQAVNVARELPKNCSRCEAPSSELRQDEDVLDTWFSSALWPFSTLGWPDQTPALATFYPTSVLETGFDIIFFWVARMIMMGLHFMKDVPFRKVYLHAMVRDEKGEKMSKSKGNVIDPLEVIDKHGADPLRFTLLSMAGQGRDIKLSLDRVEGYRAFCNKLWNAVKYLHLQYEALSNGKPMAEPDGNLRRWLEENWVELQPYNRWILARLQATVADVNRAMAAFELNEVAATLYEFTWHELCDWYIELSKIAFRDGGESAQQALNVLHYVLERLLRLMHPLMPFVTEHLWQSLPWSGPARLRVKHRAEKSGVRTLMLQKYPEVRQNVFHDPEAIKMMSALKSIVEALRNFRGENGISPKVEFPVRYHTQASTADAFIRLFAHDLRALARVSEFKRVSSLEARNGLPENVAEAVIPLSNPPLELRISLEGLVNVDEESRRLQKELEKAVEDVAFVQRKLGQESFIARAPRELVEKERRREAELVARKSELESALARLGKMKA